MNANKRKCPLPGPRITFAVPAMLSLLILVMFVLSIPTPGWAVDDEAWAVFDGKKDRVVEIRMTSGQIFVTGYDGDTVHVSARLKNPPEDVAEVAETDDPRAAGLRKITHNATGLETWGDGNVVTIATSSFGEPIDLYVRMPRNASVDIGSHFADSISVQNIQSAVHVRSNGSVRLADIRGEMEIDTHGWIYLADVTGSVVANSQFGGIEGTLNKVDETHLISLSATGPIDVALPRKTKATLHLKTSFGEVFTDFDMKVQKRADGFDVAADVPTPVRVVPPAPPASKAKGSYDEAARAYMLTRRELEKNKKGQQLVEIELKSLPLLAPSISPGLIGDINGGGPEIRLTSMSGNIYVRRGR